MRQLILSVLLMILSSQAQALRDPRVQLRTSVSIGASYFTERNEEQRTQSRFAPSIALGLEKNQLWGFFEYTRTNGTSSGNQTLNFDRHLEMGLLSLSWQATDLDLLSPYIGLGVGGLKEQVVSRLYGESSQDESSWSFVGAGFLGARLWPKSPYLLSGELRMLKSPRLDPDPALGALLRFGFLF